MPTVYVSEPVGGTRRVYRGLDVSARIGLGRYLVAMPTYSLNVAELTAASPRLLDGPSTTIVGEQLPGRPVHRAGLTLDGLIAGNKTELLANVQYTGSNNFQHLGPYMTLAAGISHDVGPGRMTLFETNIFNTYGGAFASDTYSQPLQLSNGGVLPTAAFPLTPRTLSVSYAMNVGGPRPAPALAAAAPRTVAASGPPTTGRLRLDLTPPPAGADPLALATSRTTCDATAQTAAGPVLAALRAYVTAYEGKTTVKDPDQFQVIVHQNGADAKVPYYLELRPKLGQQRNNGAPGGTSGGSDLARGQRGEGGPPGPGVGPAGPGGPGSQTIVVGPSSSNGPSPDERARFQNSPQFKAFRGFMSCAYITALTSADAKALGLAMPSGSRQGFFYIPGTGLVVVRPPQLPQGGGSLKQGT